MYDGLQFVAPTYEILTNHICDIILEEITDRIHLSMNEADSYSNEELTEILNGFEPIVNFIKNGDYAAAIDHWYDEYEYSITETLFLPKPVNLKIPDLDFYKNQIPPDSMEEPNNQDVVTNDHVCVQCGNTSCSKTEKSCWKCGCLIS